MRRRPLKVALLLSAACAVLLARPIVGVGDTPAGQFSGKPIHKVSSEEYERMRRVMPLWVNGVSTHTPGVADASALDISGWSGFDLEAVMKGIGLVFEQGNGHYPFSPPKEVLAGLVKRGAMLHADIALIVPADPSRMPSPLPSSREQHIVAQFTDARQSGAYFAGVHLEVGRALLDLLRRTEWRDDDLTSLWYTGTTAWLLRRADLADAHPQLQRAVQVLDRDPRILFFAGALHEQYAGLRWQRMVEDVKLPPGFRSPIGSSQSELQQAERLLTRSLGVDPSAAEVRLHRARVFGQLGRHAEAAAELRVVAGELKNPILLYYAALFGGEEEAALGRREAARDAFERAASLFPSAQSPLAGLSELARRSGDRAGAQAALRRLFALPRADTQRDDPWWGYYESYAGDADVLVGRLRYRFRGGTQ